MAQASIAQREPSMEEILASIRRIIEDSDPAAKSAAEDTAPEAEFFSPEPANSQEPPASADVEVFRRELHPAEAGQDEPEPDTMSFSEQDIRDLEFEPLGAEPLETGAEASAAAQDENPAPKAAGAANSLWDAAIAARPAAQEIPPPAREAPAAMPRGSIISEAAGRQVAAAFDELSMATFAAGRTRSFDEMAEEMLRPMLQDWLDNNLPTMVERLVREEIERIARGGTR